MKINSTEDIKKLDFSKGESGLLPAIVQDTDTFKVLMLGYVNAEAIEETLRSGKVTFYSRSKGRLWTKGESSQNFLHLESITADCDQDALLIKVRPAGPTCHTGSDTCFKEDNRATYGFLSSLIETIKDRKNNPTEKSYTTSLFNKGTHKIAQKVGEEAVELVIESLRNENDLFRNEGADLIFHLLVLLEDRGVSFDQIVQTLAERHK